jgi:WXXGXW repeat (2 copies)
MPDKSLSHASFALSALLSESWGDRVSSLSNRNGESSMITSSRHLARAAAVVLLLGIGTDMASAQAVIVERAMPAPIVEVVPVAPGPGFNWVPGHWAWRNGAWFWIKGHHIQGMVPVMPAPVVEVVPVRPSPNHMWVKGHHVFEGGRWSWTPGVWVRL